MSDINLKTKATGSAGGKVILLGEHAVVHGVSALAMGLFNKVSVIAQKCLGPTHLTVSAWNFDATTLGDRPEDIALSNLCIELGVGTSGVALTGDATLPARAGLGASAAIATAAAKALSIFNGLSINQQRIFNAVQASEKVFHGNPSGLDAATVTAQGVIKFSKKTGPISLSCPAPALVIINSLERGETKKTVSLFARQLKNDLKEGSRRLNKIEELVATGERHLLKGDMSNLGKVMSENHEHLRWFGVSSDRLNDICKISIEAGAMGAKLTGGGGGGCAIALVDNESRSNVIDAVETSGFQVVPT